MIPRRLLPCLLLAPVTGLRAEDAVLRQLAHPGAVGLLRHARAPGSGDPPGFRLGACETQRNLNEAGRAQARAAGARLREAGLGAARLYTSAWCRTRDTAALLELGPVEELPALNSFIRQPDAEARQTAELRAFLEADRHGPLRILVTHQVNITALTNIYPSEGEMVVLLPSIAGYAVAGRTRLN